MLWSIQSAHGSVSRLHHEVAHYRHEYMLQTGAAFTPTTLRTWGDHLLGVSQLKFYIGYSLHDIDANIEFFFHYEELIANNWKKKRSHLCQWCWFRKQVINHSNVLESYHNACGRTEVQLDDEAVPPGQEGGSSGWHQHVGVHGGGEIRLPSFR